MCVADSHWIAPSHDPVVMGGLSRRGDAPDSPDRHEGNVDAGYRPGGRRINEIFFIAFHFAAWAVPIVLLTLSPQTTRRVNWNSSSITSSSMSREFTLPELASHAVRQCSSTMMSRLWHEIVACFVFMQSKPGSFCEIAAAATYICWVDDNGPTVNNTAYAEMRMVSASDWLKL